MCGRFLLSSDPARLTARFEVASQAPELPPARWNIAPTQPILAVVDTPDGRRLGPLAWGFVPPWTTELRGARRPINARSETVASSRMFAASMDRRRCLIPADGFYEWQAREDGPKQPFHLAAADGEPLAFAGIWTRWQDPEDPDAPALISAAILTTQARGELTRIHHRVPVILPPTLWDGWLDRTPGQAERLAQAAAALGSPALIATPISTRVNHVANDGPELLEPVAVS